MPHDDKSSLGRMYRGETAPPITTPDAVAATAASRAAYDKPGAVTIQVYFSIRHVDSPILQASMLAYTNIRVATLEAFDKIFEAHHNVVEEKKP